MSPQANIETLIYNHRRAISSVLLLTILYFITASRLSLPSLILSLGWQPETQLRVLSPIEEAYRPFVQEDDIVLAVDGRPVERGEIIFMPPVPNAYELTLQRGDAILVQEVPVAVSQLFQVWELSKGGLALLIWLLGFLITQFARSDQISAALLGLGFQLIAAGIISPGPTQLGLPGAWLVGHVLIYYFPLIILYASFLPRYSPFNGGVRKMLWGSFFVLSGMALVSTYEYLFLFPARSLVDMVGVSNQTILTVLTGLSLVTAVAVLAVRLLRLNKLSYERQQLLILLVCFGLAVTPLFFFVILPVTAITFAPFPFIYSFLLLIPAAYFFVLHRQGYLELDNIFSQIITVAVLILFFVMAYATGAYLLITVFQKDFSAISQGFWAMLLFGIAVSGQKSVQTYVDMLTYGRYLPGEVVLRAAKTRLSADPEPATVTEAVMQITAHLQIPQIAVLVKQDNHYRWLAGNTSPFTISVTDRSTFRLRSRTQEEMEGLPDWVELSLPIMVGEEVTGLFLLASPVNGYFNDRQVRLLRDVTDTLAFSLQVLSLMEMLHGLTETVIYEKEMQRQEIATEIHNRPLHALTNVQRRLELMDDSSEVRYVRSEIGGVSQDLRGIIADLRPRILVENIHWLSRQVVRGFGETNEEIEVRLHLHVDKSQKVSDLVKRAYYHVLIEALNNINKHAQARQVDVTVRCEDELLLIVEDDGIGPGVATQSLLNLLRNCGVGVVDMHRWARIAGGRLDIKERDGGGTVITLVLPRVAPERKMLSV
ncbi:MAG: ATP-binding protein [Chloroflexota bacterium]